MHPTNIVFLGPAGCGKSSLTGTFSKWLEEEMEFKVAYVNLDPGAFFNPYQPDYDIRSLITVEKIMKNEKLGPNGAMIRCMDLMVKFSKKIASEISKLKADFCLIDTPGQMEPFLLRRAGPEIMKTLSKIGNTVAVFIVAPELWLSASGLIIVNLLAIVVQLRLSVPSVVVFNKADLVRDRERIELPLTNPEYLKAQINKETEGLVSDLAYEIADKVFSMSQAARLVCVSAKTGEGMDQLYDLIHEVFCVCGDLT